jgi:hypothetical protein
MTRNVELELAEQYVLYTRKHCFLTGKAGTGKTTFLRKLVKATKKNLIIAAPTGVAAVNAGGVTLHSMFGLPLTCFVPSDDPVDPVIATNRARLLSEHLRLRREKIDVLRELDLLIIDEVSMVRCDILDAVDLVLRTVRGNPQPFGDVQLLLIGDVHQLPPVARDREWNVLERYYRSPFLFDSLVWPQLAPVRIELQAVYRQSDARFLELLNNIRHRAPSEDDLRLLRERYRPGFAPTEPGYVLLSSHNYKADSVNSAGLASLAGRVHAFTAEITGEFPENSFPCDATVQLKVGAQVMFIRNDTEGGAYYNGKLATVKSIEGTEITVIFRESGQDYMLHRETWESIGYRLDEQSGELKPEVLGTFSQYPLRLAWAITIHKSQGLTFDKVIIDAGGSFAPGQVYVALSRCRSLDGIILHSLIAAGALREDRRIDAFGAGHHRSSELAERLPAARTEYASYLLTRLFSFTALTARLDEWQALIAATTLPDRPAAVALHERIREQAGEIESVAEKFRRQLKRLQEALRGDAGTLPLLKERCCKAIEYFTGQIATELARPLRAHINRLAYRKKVKRYLAVVQLIETGCWNAIERLYEGKFFDEPLYTDTPRHAREHEETVVTSLTSGSQEKGGTFRDTLDLHRQGKTASQIATLRGMSLATIKSHLARWIEHGEVSVYDVVPAETIAAVLAFLREHTGASLKEIRSGTGDQFDWNDLRMIIAHSSRASAAGGTPRVTASHR